MSSERVHVNKAIFSGTILAFHIDAHLYRQKDLMCYLNVRQCFHYPDYGCGTSQKVVDLDDTDFNLMRFGDRITG